MGERFGIRRTQGDPLSGGATIEWVQDLDGEPLLLGTLEAAEQRARSYTRSDPMAADYRAVEMGPRERRLVEARRERIRFPLTDFWSVVDNARMGQRGTQGTSWRLVELLSGRERDDILRWGRVYISYYRMANKEKLRAAAAVMYPAARYDPGFSHFRGWLIAQGRQVYQGALHDPDSLAELGRREVEAGAQINSAASAAFEAVTGEAYQQYIYDYYLPEDTAISMCLPIDFAPDLDGAFLGDAADPENQFPRLSALYGPSGQVRGEPEMTL